MRLTDFMWFGAGDEGQGAVWQRWLRRTGPRCLEVRKIQRYFPAHETSLVFVLAESCMDCSAGGGGCCWESVVRFYAVLCCFYTVLCCFYTVLCCFYAVLYCFKVCHSGMGCSRCLAVLATQNSDWASTVVDAAADGSRYPLAGARFCAKNDRFCTKHDALVLND